MRNVLKSLAFLLLFSLLVACGADIEEEDTAVDEIETGEEVTDESETSQDAFPVTSTDAIGNEVTIEEEPERIVSLISSNTENIYALGMGDRVVGVTENDNYPEEVLEIEQVAGMEINVEMVIGLEPDLVLGHELSYATAQEAYQQLEDAGMNVYVVEDAVDIAATYDVIHEIGEVLGKSEEAEQIVGDMQTEFEEISEMTADGETQTVLFEIEPEPLFAAASGTFLDELLKITNGENVLSDMEGWPEIDPELIIERDPDIIVNTYGDYIDNAVDGIMERNGFESVAAVANERVYTINSDITSRSGPRLVDAAWELAEVVNPELIDAE